MIYELNGRRPVVKGDVFVAPNAAVIGNVVLGHGASVWWNVTIRGDNDTITIGDNVNVQDGSVVHADENTPVTLHRNVTIGHLVMLHGCTIHENSLVGIGAIVLNRAVVGRNCIVGAGSLVPEGRVIPDNSLVMGVPCRVVREMTPKDIELNAWIANHYVERAGEYRNGLKPIG